MVSLNSARRGKNSQELASLIADFPFYLFLRLKKQYYSWNIAQSIRKQRRNYSKPEALFDEVVIDEEFAKGLVVRKIVFLIDE